MAARMVVGVFVTTMRRMTSESGQSISRMKVSMQLAGVVFMKLKVNG